MGASEFLRRQWLDRLYQELEGKVGLVAGTGMVQVEMGAK